MFFKKIYAAFINSFKGIYRALQEEFAFQVEFILSATTEKSQDRTESTCVESNKFDFPSLGFIFC